MKRIVLTGGGTTARNATSGAAAALLKNGYEVHYIGSKAGVERDIMSLPASRIMGSARASCAGIRIGKT